MSDYDRYVSIVYAPRDIVEWRLIRRLGGRPEVKSYWCQARECGDKLRERLLEHNDEGWHIYAGVNPRKEHGKKGDVNVLLARWVFADFDHVEPGDGCGRWEFVSDVIHRSGLDNPDIVICSGNGLHTYWKLTEPCTNLERWRSLQGRLADALGSDPAIKNPERIMRTPGFKNVKDASNPKDAYIIFQGEKA